MESHDNKAVHAFQYKRKHSAVQLPFQFRITRGTPSIPVNNYSGAILYDFSTIYFLSFRYKSERGDV